MDQQLIGGLITVFGGVLLTACGYRWLNPSWPDLFGSGWLLGMKILGPLMILVGVFRILFATPT